MADTPGAPAAPAPSAPGAAPGAPSPSTHNNGVQSDVTTEQARSLYGDLVAAGTLTREQANQTMIAEGLTPPDAAVSARMDAQNALDRIMQGRDPAFSRAYIDKNDPGHAAAKDKMAALRAAVSATTPPPAARPSEAQVLHQANVGPAIAFEIAHNPTDLPADRVASQQAANIVAQTMGVEPEAAAAAVKNLAKAIASRQTVDPVTGNMAVGKVMDAGEMKTMDKLLSQQWGPAHDENVRYVREALKSAGKGAQWIKNSIRQAGPMAAAMAMNELARHGRALAARGKR